MRTQIHQPNTSTHTSIALQVCHPHILRRLSLLTLLLLTIGVGNMSSDNWYEHNNDSHIYFNDYTTNWVTDPSSDGITFLIGRDHQYDKDPNAGVGSQAYRMSHIANTRLWYASVPNWGTGNPAMYQYIAFRFAAGTTGWDDWDNTTVTTRAQYGSNTKYSCTYNHNITGRYQYYAPNSSTANATMDAYEPFNNQKVTAYLRVKYDERDGNGYGSIITGETTWTHGVTMDFTGTYMASVSTSAQSTISNLNKNYWMDDATQTWGYGGIPPTGEVTFELKSIDTGFEIEGWAYAVDATTPAYTDNVTHPTFQVLATTSYVAMIRRKQYTITLNDDGGSGGSGSITTTYDKTSNLTTNVSIPTKSGYTFQGYYTGYNGTGSMVINSSGAWQSSVTGYTGVEAGDPKWIRDESVTLYAKWTSTNFVIYRSGDMEEDSRKAVDDVESYAGGTISEIIEYRMKVRTLDQWYSLCLPFTVNAVQVYEDGTYYDLKPFYRTGSGYFTGDYIIRTPATTPGLAIANFGDWDDPESPTSYLPSKNKPYIIQWHDSYFLNRYVSFFGAAGQEIPTSMTTGAAPASDDKVNIYGNNAMVSGSVAGAYMLEEDYGSGAWLRLDDASASRTVLPFECYIRASSTVTGKYRVIRRDMHAEDTATGWDDVVNSETRTTITVYSLTGICIAHFSNCSINDVAQRLNNEQHEGIYILRTDNECVKLIL